MISLPLPQSLKIRQAVEDDGIEILRLIQQSFADYVSKTAKENSLKNPALEESLEDIHRDIKNSIVLVIENKDRVIASLRLERVGEDKFYLKRFAVLPGYQNQGLGTQLFYAAEKKVLQQQGSLIYLHSSLENDLLLRFYYKLGFKCVEIDRKNGYKRGLWLKEIKGPVL